MRYAIFSDIHGNLQAMDAVLDAVKQEKADRCFFVVDVVGYGANPHECIDMLRGLDAVSIAGNHDWAVAGKVDLAYFNDLARDAIIWTQKYALREDMEFLNRLKLLYKNEDMILAHGTLHEPEAFHYLMNRFQAAESFRVMDRTVCFVGHSHTPGVFIQKEEKIQYFSHIDFHMEEKGKYLVNVGSVGQPRDHDPRAAYCIFDADTKKIILKRVPYDIAQAQKRILQAGLPPFLAGRLAAGQ